MHCFIRYVYTRVRLPGHVLERADLTRCCCLGTLRKVARVLDPSLGSNPFRMRSGSERPPQRRNMARYMCAEPLSSRIHSAIASRLLSLPRQSPSG